MGLYEQPNDWVEKASVRMQQLICQYLKVHRQNLGTKLHAAALPFPPKQ